MCQCDTDAPPGAIVGDKKSPRYDWFTNIDKIYAGFVTCQYADILTVWQVPFIHSCNKEQKQNSNRILRP